MSTEYLPPESEQNALTVPEASEVETREEYYRLQCSACSHEVGGRFKSSELAFNLLEKSGWKVGRQILCPECVKKAARKFFDRYNSETR